MLKILLLDDDELNNELVVMLMNLEGLQDIDIRTSGEAGLEYLDQCKQSGKFPDLIFVDLNMPGIKGLTFVDQYEKNYRKASPAARIIILTNSVLRTEKEEALRFESVMDVWNKPVTKEKLKKILEAM